MPHCICRTQILLCDCWGGQQCPRSRLTALHRVRQVPTNRPRRRIIFHLCIAGSTRTMPISWSRLQSTPRSVALLLSHFLGFHQHVPTTRVAVVLNVSNLAGLLLCCAHSCRGLPLAQDASTGSSVPERITSWIMLQSACVICAQGALRGELTKSS